jgi:hypothetical protein
MNSTDWALKFGDKGRKAGRLKNKRKKEDEKKHTSSIVNSYYNGQNFQ